MKILVLCLALFVPLLAQGQVVDMDIQPAAPSMLVGQTITLAVRAVAGTNHVDTVEADLNFDPAVLQVVSITPRAIMGGGGTTNFDNTLGQTNIALSTSAAFETGTFFVADVAFLAIAPSLGTVVSYSVTTPRISQASLVGVPYTGTFSSATIVVSALTATPTVGGPTPTRTPPTPCGPSVPCAAGLDCVPFTPTATRTPT